VADPNLANSSATNLISVVINLLILPANNAANLIKKSMKTLIITFVNVVLACVLSINATAQQSFKGTWYWENSESSVSFIFSQIGNKISGVHCCVLDNGNHIDCEEDTTKPTIQGTVDGASINLSFTSTFSLTKGKAVVKRIDNNTIEWTITKAPSGIFYIPKHVILKRE